MSLLFAYHAQRHLYCFALSPPLPRAREMGASEGEIGETVRAAFIAGGVPALVTALRAYK